MRSKSLLFILLGLLCIASASAQTISGTVNAYASVSAISGNTLTVNSSAPFAVGDLVLVIQMKGATINQANTAAYGNITAYGDAGNYEFNSVGSIAGNDVTLACNLTNTYSPSGAVQLVRVPQYTSVAVSANLTGQDWNGSTGGVIAIDVTDTLTLNANINADNRGFRGGTFRSGGFSCGHADYRSGVNQGGDKGEAIAAYIIGQETARGKIANGGGGSNRGNCGGGGGSNAGGGGLGGRIYSGCGASTIQGVGGAGLTYINTKTFLGGGGGGGFRDNGQTSTNGADGGGIVIIMAGTIIGNGNSILSRGGNVTTVTNDEGAGGGGGGGTVYLDCNNFPNALTVNTSGGNGGNILNTIFTTNCHGPGGGGGGGMLWVAPAALPANITHTTGGGNAGIVQTPNAAACFNTTYQGTNGASGTTNLNLVIPIATGGGTINLGADTTLCAGDTLLLNAGPGATTYLWQDNSANQTFEATTTGQYHVAVTGGCSPGADTINITFAPNPVVNLGADQSVCMGASGLFDAGPGFTGYLWQDNSIAQTFSGTTTGQVNVTVTDANGCTGADTAQLTVNPLPPINLGPDVAICAGQTQTFDAGAPAGVAGYLWNNNATTQTITVGTSGNYSATITDVNGCQNTDNVNLTVNPLPTPNLGPDQDICNGSTIVLSPGVGYTNYNWTTSAITPTLLVSATGNYGVTVTDANGCMASDNIIITVNPNPVVDLGGNQLLCEGNTLTLDPGAGFNSYFWQDNSTNQTLTVSQPGTYWVTVIDGNNCIGQDTVSVTVEVVSVNLGPDVDLCEGEGLLLSAGANFNSYAWSDGSNTQNNYVTNVGTYSVVATSLAGCSASDTMQVLSVILVPKVDLGGPYEICEGEQIVLNAGNNPAWTVTWNDGTVGPTLTVTETGVYTATGSNSCGNISHSARVTNLGLPPAPDLGADITFCRDTIVLSPGLDGDYIWSNGYTGPSLVVDQGGEYTVIITNECGVGEDVITLTEDCPPRLWVPTAFSPNGDGINDIFRPVGLDIQDYLLQVFDRWGMMIFESQSIEIGWDGLFSGKGVPEGVYVYRIDYRGTKSAHTEVERTSGSVTLIR